MVVGFGMAPIHSGRPDIIETLKFLGRNPMGPGRFQRNREAEG